MNLNYKNKLLHILNYINNNSYKDEILFHISTVANVAQFISFAPGENIKLRFLRIRGFSPDHRFDSPEHAIKALLNESPARSINIRSFDPSRPKAGEFIYGEKNPDEIIYKVKRLARDGFYTILNETIDVKDGGVSGVSFAGLLEFSAEDTPKCVDKPGICTLPYELGTKLLKKVYGFKPDLEYPRNVRVEFSIHPFRQGYKKQHTIIWELEKFDEISYEAKISWPNRFSRYIGDKAFGLLIADILGFDVPSTLVIGRHIKPFELGKSTGTKEYWMRTSPPEPVPGHFKTIFGWVDPFKFIEEQDNEGDKLTSLLIQESVDFYFSGAALVGPTDDMIIEGVKGKGDKFMLGIQSPDVNLPESVQKGVKNALLKIKNILGPVKIEWVADKKKVWIVQLHLLQKKNILQKRDDEYFIYPGKAKEFIRFNINQGLESLRELISEIKDREIGIELIGNVGVTSHFGDLLRRARIPSRIKRLYDNIIDS